MAPRRTPPPPLRAARKRPESVAPMFSSAVYARLGPAPRGNDRAAAASYRERISTLLVEDNEATSSAKLKRTARQGLARLELRWRRRAAGLDLRWNLVGVRAGRLDRTLEAQTRPAPDPAWKDPE